MADMNTPQQITDAKKRYSAGVLEYVQARPEGARYGSALRRSMAVSATLRHCC